MATIIEGQLSMQIVIIDAEIKINVVTDPCINSGNISSIDYVSLEIRLMIRPRGFVSKNAIF